MGLAAFNRMRRMKAQKAKKKESAQGGQLRELTVKQLKAVLDEKGIKYNLKAKKSELIDLFLGAEMGLPSTKGEKTVNKESADDNPEGKKAEENEGAE